MPIAYSHLICYSLKYNFFPGAIVFHFNEREKFYQFSVGGHLCFFFQFVINFH